MVDSEKFSPLVSVSIIVIGSCASWGVLAGLVIGLNYVGVF